MSSFIILKINSWTIVSENTFIKQMDKSSFNHDGTGIPKKIQMFWQVDGMMMRSKKVIKLIYNNYEYQAYIYCDPIGRTRLHWYSDFRNIIHEKYFELSFLYKSGDDVDQSPQIMFTRAKDNEYNVDFVDVMSCLEYSQVKEESSIYNKDISEGKVIYSFSKKYERNSKVKELAIKKHGLKCDACGFVFEDFYGELGKGYIEIHHKKPLYINGEEVAVDIENDLCPLCSNCHRMIHRRRTKLISVEKLRNLICN